MIQDATYSTYYFNETIEGYVPNYYGGGNDSIVINRDGFLAINITPEWYEYCTPTPTPSYVSSAFFIIIQRFGKNINIISNSVGISSNREITGGIFNYVYDTNTVLNLNNTLLHYIDTGSAYNNGVISIFPTYIINDSNDIKQSDNVVIFNKNALATGGEIELKDKNGLPYTYVGFSGRMDIYFKNTGRIAVRL